ncbi:helix-turn-helix transcriptional regulator [Paenibacillus sinopodophylli]|uniref:helix-turn-helix transcriptional regulator n=1 Tax=Paenibacillus sinopodophylli TaxID=1837342 RepID=UPI00110D1672|nr:helix-turn-helix transcriptional regulator [Paenibacillus sinopodophylli]
MSIVENIRVLCKDAKTSIPKLEKELGFGNGAIYNWDKNSPSIDKIQKVADHFKVSVDIVLYGFDLTRFEELFRIIMNRRTCEQFAEDTGIDLGIIEDYAYGISTVQPSLDLLKKIANENPYKFIVDDKSLFEAAGYSTKDLDVSIQEQPIQINILEVSTMPHLTDEPEIRAIQRAAKNMTPTDKKKMLNMVKAAFEEAFEGEDNNKS